MNPEIVEHPNYWPNLMAFTSHKVTKRIVMAIG